jgi:beta-lactamase superfamily II metal-dependent hydrolase
MFKIEMLKAAWGDCLWIEYGDRTKPYRILIDGGITSTYESVKRRVLDLPEGKRYIDLFVITHIDEDHIAGSVKLLGRLNELDLTFGDIWFNGYEHMEKMQKAQQDDRMGGLHGEFLSALIKERRLNWNNAFNNEPVVVGDTGELPVANLPGKMKLTILSPTSQNLIDLIPEWNKNLEDTPIRNDRSLDTVLEVLDKRAALRPEDDFDDRLGRRVEIEINNDQDIKKAEQLPYSEDKAKPNGSSIAFLMEYKDPEDGVEKKCIMTGDAFPSVIKSSLERLPSYDGSKIKIDLLKLSHHGSRNNTSNDLLKLLNCTHYLFSSSGQKFFHPDKETVARVLIHGRGKRNPQLYFNYSSKFNEAWKNENLAHGQYGYDPHYIDDATDAIDDATDAVVIEL